MTKRFFIAIILFYTAVVMCTLCYFLTNKITNIITETINTTENYILADKDDLAINQAKILKNNWEKQYKVLSSYISHEDLERTEVAINSIANYLYLEDYSAALIVCEDIRVCAEHLLISEKPTFWNIF